MKKINKETLRMQMLAGIITESQYKAKLNENELNTLKQTIQQEYPEIVQGGEIETGTEEWIFLLKLALKSMYDTEYKGYFDDIDEYDLFISGKYEPYYKMIEDDISSSYDIPNNLQELLYEMDSSDLIDNICQEMGGDWEDANDMREATNALLAYGVNELDDFSHVDNLEQALEELGVEII
jgi:hypothetical protein